MIRFGLIGCGRIADRHIASLAACRGAELAALCDIREERMREAEQAYRMRGGVSKGISQHLDVDHLLQDDRIDAIVICTHSALHAELALRALQAGKHVILEKPMTLSLADAKHIIQLAEEKALKVQICHQLRYRPLMRRVKDLIEQGALGRVYMGTATIRLQRSKRYYEEAHWRGTWEQDGGMLLNQGIHLIDLLQWFLGDAVHVYGKMARTSMPKETEDIAAGIIQFAGGGIGIIEANTISKPSNFDNAVTLFAERGTISIGGIKMNEIRRWYIEDGAQPPDEYELKMDEHQLMYESYVRALEGDADQMLIDAGDGSKALEMIFALYESVRQGREISLPLGNFATTMMTEWEG